MQADAAVLVLGALPGLAARGRRRREAELVVARVGGREGEAALLVAALRDDAVVVVEDFLRGFPLSALLGTFLFCVSLSWLFLLPAVLRIMGATGKGEGGVWHE